MSLQDRIIAWLAGQDIVAYLVGGCVRDRLLGRPVYDLDVAVAGDGLHIARQLANEFHGAYYPLDQARATGRALLRDGDGRLVVDVARLRGANPLALSLAEDLADRDFTVNALAAPVETPDHVIDYHGGLDDLRARLIRPVSEASIRNDPLRALRAVRLAAELDFALATETQELIRRDGAALAAVSGERARDELARLLALPCAAPFLVTLDDLQILTVLFPELEPLRGLSQPPPHHLTVLAHSLEAVHCLEQILAFLVEPAACLESAPAGGRLPLLAALFPFRERLQAHLAQPSGEARRRLVILKLTLLLHDVGKAVTRTVDEDGRIRFIDHDRQGSWRVESALQRLRFSAPEVRLAKVIVSHHMRPLLLANQESISSRAVYRFFRDTGEAGVDVLIHALADDLATRGTESGEDRWAPLVSLVARMLADYWERAGERVMPPKLVDGTDLLTEFGLQPGPDIGRLLEAVREAQVSGEVRSRDEALALIRSHLRRKGH